MATIFKIGDVVRLESGGPKMTVTQVGEESMTGQMTAWCAWFNGNEQDDGTFPVDAVELVS